MEVVKIGRPVSQQPVPANFRYYAAQEGDLRLRKRYGVGRSVILRWRNETGVYCGAPRGPRRAASRSAVTRPKPYRSTPKRSYNSHAMDEISWFDGEEDIGTLMSASGISAWGD